LNMGSLWKWSQNLGRR